MEFHRRDPSRAPGRVRRGIKDNAEAVQAQRSAIAGQQVEQGRINAAFDEEAARLRQLWRSRTAAGAGDKR